MSGFSGEVRQTNRQTAKRPPGIHQLVVFCGAATPGAGSRAKKKAKSKAKNKGKGKGEEKKDWS